MYAGKIVAKATLTKHRAKEKVRAMTAIAVNQLLTPLPLQLKTEIQIHRSLHHKYVVGFHSFFEDRDNVYILLELCSNQVSVKQHAANASGQCYCQHHSPASWAALDALSLAHFLSVQSMMELHKRRRGMTEPEARWFLLQIAEATSYMHNRKVSCPPSLSPCISAVSCSPVRLLLAWPCMHCLTNHPFN